MNAESISFVEKPPEENQNDFRKLSVNQFFTDNEGNLCQALLCVFCFFCIK